MTTLVTTLMIDVLGTPAPQGSKSFKGMRGGHPILVESSSKVKPWRQQVETAARARMNLTGWLTSTGPVEVTIMFWLRAPKTMPKGRIYPTTYPDISKLARSTEDALVTAGVLADDALIITEHLAKRYARQTTGARITITPLGDQGALL